MTTRTPLWLNIHRQLLERIHDGTYALGTMLPAERELMMQFDVSRQTIRRALTELTHAGYIRRTPHIGTQIINTGAQSRFTYDIQSYSTLDPYRARPIRDVLVEETFVYKADYERKLPFELGRELIHCMFLRRLQNAESPLGLTRAWLFDSGVSYRDRIEANVALPLINLYCTATGYICHKIVQNVRAVGVSPLIARELGRTEGEPILEIERIFLNSMQRPILFTLNYFADPEFDFSLELVRTPVD